MQDVTELPMPPPWRETASASPRGRGRIVPRYLPGSHSLAYYEYVPTCPVARILVSVHGTSRNALEHALYLIGVAERRGAVVVAPAFRRRRHRGYQRLQQRKRGERGDLLLHRILAAVSAELGLPEAPVSLFGFSGGAQFAHRYAMVFPERIESLVLASAGWYTLPDPTLPYPLGLRIDGDYQHLRLQLERFLALPIHVAVGMSDTEEDEMLNTAPEIVELQGANRVERARSWVERLRAAAHDKGVAAQVDLTELPGVGHSFAQSVHKGRLDLIIDQALRKLER